MRCLWLGRCRTRAGDAGGAIDALEAARAALGGALVPGFVKLIDALESEIAELPAPPPPRPIDATLTAAEISVLELLPTALTVREIADRLESPSRGGPRPRAADPAQARRHDPCRSRHRRPRRSGCSEGAEPAAAAAVVTAWLRYGAP